MTEDESQAKKELIAGVFGRAAPAYDRTGPRFFTHFGQRLVAHARIPLGARVLDIAAGRGAVLFPAAAQVGPAGRVIGIDLAGPMVEETAAEITQRGLKNAEIRQMDAEALAFPDVSFDRVLCGFALFFFPKLHKALSEFHRVLKPGGILAATTWGTSDERWAWVPELLKTYQLPVELGTQDLDKPADLEAAFRGAGFADVRVVAEEADFVYEDEEEWWATRWSHGSRATLERMSAVALEKFKGDVFRRMQPLKQPDGFHVLLRVLYALGIRPRR